MMFEMFNVLIHQVFARTRDVNELSCKKNIHKLETGLYQPKLKLVKLD